MRGRDHAAIALGSTVLLLSVAQASGVRVATSAYVTAGLAASAGAWAPDIDHRWSTASGILPVTLVAYGGAFLVFRSLADRTPALKPLVTSMLGAAWTHGAWIAVALGFLLGLLALAANTLFGHRGIVHSLAFGAGCAAVVAIALAISGWEASPAAWFAWGWLTHLAADVRGGLPHLFWPLTSGVTSGGLNRRIVSDVRPNRVRSSPHDSQPAAARSVCPPSLMELQHAEPRPVPTVTVPVCPACGVPMVLRTARRGSRAGGQFYGCRNFPRCRKTEPLT